MAMGDAVIGSTGFVGGHLLRQHAFAASFNSRNICKAAGEAFHTVVCAAAPGSMFQANRFPDRDQAQIDALIDSLSTIDAQRFVLISSIAVLADCAGQDETMSSFETGLAYGRNRRALERFCVEHFSKCLIVRIPALFGEGLKKNFVFDILNPMPSMLARARLTELSDRLPVRLRDGLSGIYSWDDGLELFVIDREALGSTGQRAAYDAAVTELGLSAIQFTHPDSSFQYYDMTRLWADIALCLDHGLGIVHLAPEPLPAREVFAALTGGVMAPNSARLHREDMRTAYAGLFGRDGVYIADADVTLEKLKRFAANLWAHA
ncbi:hypothetical protein LPW26_19695 [Rhodopseudomonas sp. HC1]|uniref:NAD-dependent epimerase/dehydratase family protein n=1 Tax=Rhodopseudomonas infernalis TaxID=2897386 RepID=UPI001EE7AC88|nr:NAD-dependent epimerase/dehydratase family protein [Rhodopseudomonas infernalis]MCG6206874.1 hypothetical protein [Rhodopseudomonas infernalis]